MCVFAYNIYISSEPGKIFQLLSVKNKSKNNFKYSTRFSSTTCLDSCYFLLHPPSSQYSLLAIICFSKAQMCPYLRAFTRLFFFSLPRSVLSLNYWIYVSFWCFWFDPSESFSLAIFFKIVTLTFYFIPCFIYH